jgi:crotonobetainyl-CoA:carnitine CoA-transferase CaiB-like acyl-CoA transferase
VLVEALQAVFLTKSYEDWESILIGAGVPVGAINTIADLVDHPQVRARGALVDSEHPTAGRIRVVGPPARLSETPGALRRPAPRLGEHTREILTGIGVDAAAIARHEAAGVIACAAPR